MDFAKNIQLEVTLYKARPKNYKRNLRNHSQFFHTAEGARLQLSLSSTPMNMQTDKPALSRGKSQGTTVTRAPRRARQRIWLYLMPQSTTVMRKLPLGLKTRGSWEE